MSIVNQKKTISMFVNKNSLYKPFSLTWKKLLLIIAIVLILTVLIVLVNAYLVEPVQCGGGPEWPKGRYSQEELKMAELIQQACEHTNKQKIIVDTAEYNAGKFPSCDFAPLPPHAAVSGPNQVYSICTTCRLVMCSHCNLG
jgi:hypothetical protein